MTSAQSKLRLEIERPPDAGELVNLVQNPSGDLGAWGYITPVPGSVLRASGGRLIYTSPGAVASYFTTEPVPVAAGDHAQAAWVADAVTGYYRASIEWLDNAGAVLSTTAVTGYLSASAAQQNYGAFQAPASTVWARLRLQPYANTSGGHPAAASTMAVHQVTLASSDVSAALAVNRTNLLPNPSGESATGWTSPDGAGITSVTAQHYVGTRSLRVVRTGQAGVMALLSPAVAITPGRDVALQARVRPGATARTVALEAWWFDATNQVIGTGVKVDAATETLGAWSAPAAGVATAPSNATTVRLRLRFGNKAALNEVHYADAMMIEQAGKVLGYFDGDTPDAGGVVYAWSGTPHASASTASANAALPELSPVQWINVLGPTREISVVREGLNAGTLTATIFDSVLDPTQAEHVRPGRRVRLVTDTGEVIYTGKTLNASVKYELLAKDAQKQARVSLTAVDAVQTLAAAARSEGVAEISDLPYVLEGAGVPWSVNGSGDQVPTATVVATNGNASAVDQLVVTRDTNLGYAWLDRNGVVQAWDRDQLPTTSVATLDETVYNAAVDIDFDTERLINAVTVVVLRQVATTGVTEEVPYGPFRDEDSIDEWGLHAESFTVQGFTGDDAAVEAATAAYAAQILGLNAVPAIRVNSVQVPIRDEADLSYALLDLYDLVTVVNARAGIDEGSRIARLEHTITGEKWLLTVGFTTDGSVAPSLSTATPPPGIGAVRDEINETVTIGLQEAFDAADAAAAAAAEAALNGTAAMTAANGKNKVTYSSSGPGTTPNTAGDIWWQRSGGLISGQWEGLGGTDWEGKTLAGEVIAYLDAGQLTAGSAFINGLSVKTNFTLGDASTNGVIQSYNFASEPVGIYIDKYGFVAKGGQMTGTAIVGATVTASSLQGPYTSDVAGPYGVDINHGGILSKRHDGSGGCFTVDNYTGMTTVQNLLVNNDVEVLGNLDADTITTPFLGNISGGGDIGCVGNLVSFSDMISARVKMTTAPTSAAAANVYIDTDGLLHKSTSSLRYKDVTGATDLDPATVLALDDVAFTQKDSDSDRVWFGFTAEQAHDLGLTQFVDYDEAGDPDGFGYGTFAAVGHQVVLRAHDQRHDAAEQRIAELEATVQQLLNHIGGE